MFILLSQIMLLWWFTQAVRNPFRIAIFLMAVSLRALRVEGRTLVLEKIKLGRVSSKRDLTRRSPNDA